MKSNKERFMELIMSIDRPTANIEALLVKLESSDWYTAPASTKYHGSFEGGLVAHSLKVYDNLKLLNEQFNLGLDEDSMLIVGLLHDMSKMNLYQVGVKNEKVYFDGGSKHDNMGNFDWRSVPFYKTAPEDERFIFGNHEETSEFMIRNYIPLSYEESAAIINHHAGMGWDSVKDTGVASSVYRRYKLAAALHIADIMAAQLENI